MSVIVICKKLEILIIFCVVKGANSYGQLGQGCVSEECRHPIEVIIKEAGEIESISGGANHSFLLMKDGSVMTCGAFGGNVKGESLTSFKKICRLDGLQAVKAESMWDTSLVVTADKKCIGWGSNNFGQLGTKPTKFEDFRTIGENIVDAAVGLRHTIILTDTGIVFSSGNGKSGQLGRPFNTNDGFQEIKGIQNVKSITCGTNHSIALTESGRVFAWGSNKFGQLGIDIEQVETAKYPIEIEVPLSADELSSAKIMSGWTHSAILTKNGQFVNWGRNNYSQLGDDSKIFRWKPKLMDKLKFSDVVLGAEHNLGLTETGGKLLTWGWNEHGSCAAPEDIVLTPMALTLTDVCRIGGGASQSFAITN